MNYKTPTLEEKVKQYEEFLHNINTMMVASNGEGIQRLLSNADDFSYAHRAGNGELPEDQQQDLINRKFWMLNCF